MTRAIFISLVFSLSLLAFSGRADDRTSLGKFRDWDAYLLNQGGQKICFAISVPKREEPTNVNHGEIYLTVTHRPTAKVFDEVNFVAGYSFRKDSEAVMSIGGRSFKMFTEGDAAWAYDSRSDKAMVEGMKRGSEMVIRATSARGTNTRYVFSLMGFTAAHNAIDSACGQ